jgi:hypothetical protein
MRSRDVILRWCNDYNDGLDDVTITSVSSGELLSYDGSAWVNIAPVAFNPIEAAVFL